MTRRRAQDPIRMSPPKTIAFCVGSADICISSDCSLGSCCGSMASDEKPRAVPTSITCGAESRQSSVTSPRAAQQRGVAPRYTRRNVPGHSVNEFSRKNSSRNHHLPSKAPREIELPATERFLRETPSSKQHLSAISSPRQPRRRKNSYQGPYVPPPQEVATPPNRPRRSVTREKRQPPCINRQQQSQTLSNTQSNAHSKGYVPPTPGVKEAKFAGPRLPQRKTAAYAPPPPPPRFDTSSSCATSPRFPRRRRSNEQSEISNHDNDHSTLFNDDSASHFTSQFSTRTPPARVFSKKENCIRLHLMSVTASECSSSAAFHTDHSSVRSSSVWNHHTTADSVATRSTRGDHSPRKPKRCDRDIVLTPLSKEHHHNWNNNSQEQFSKSTAPTRSLSDESLIPQAVPMLSAVAV